MVSVSVHHLFYQPVDEKIKTWPLCFPAKENPNMEKGLFDWPIALQYDVKAKYRLIFPLVCCFCFVRAFSFWGHTKIALILTCAARIYLRNIYILESVSTVKNVLWWSRWLLNMNRSLIFSPTHWEAIPDQSMKPYSLTMHFLSSLPDSS